MSYEIKKIRNLTKLIFFVALILGLFWWTNKAFFQTQLSKTDNIRNQERNAFANKNDDDPEKKSALSHDKGETIDSEQQSSVPSSDSTDIPEPVFPSMVESQDAFLPVFLSYIFQKTPSVEEIMGILKKSGGMPSSAIAGNEETGKRIEVTLQNEKALGFSKFMLVYQLSEKESFERFIFGRAPLKENWNTEFNKLKQLLEDEFGKKAVSKSERPDFATWRLAQQRLLWVNGKYEGYEKPMILVGFEYEIH